MNIEETTTESFTSNIQICQTKIKRQYQPLKQSKFAKNFKATNPQQKESIHLNSKNLSIHKSNSYFAEQQNIPRQVFDQPSELQSYDAIEYLRFIVQQARSVDIRVSKTALNILNSFLRSLLYGKDVSGIIPGLSFDLNSPSKETIKILNKVLKFLFILPNVTLYGRDLLKDEDVALEMPSSDVILEILYLHIIKGTVMIPEALELLATFVLQDEGFLAENLATFTKKQIAKIFPASTFLKSLIQLQLPSIVLRALQWCEQQQLPQNFERTRVTAFLILERIILSLTSINQDYNVEVVRKSNNQATEVTDSYLYKHLVNIFTNELLMQLKDMNNGHFLTTGRIVLRTLRFLEIPFDQLTGLNALRQLLSQRDHQQLHEILSAAFWISLVSGAFSVFLQHFRDNFEKYKENQTLTPILSEIIFYSEINNYEIAEEMKTFINSDNMTLFGRLHNLQDDQYFEELEKENKTLLVKYLILQVCNADLTVISDLNVLQIMYSIHHRVNYQSVMEQNVILQLQQYILNVSQNLPIFSVQLALLSGQYQEDKIIHWLSSENIKLERNKFNYDLLFYNKQHIFTLIALYNKHLNVSMQNDILKKFNFNNLNNQLEQQLATLLIILQKDIIYLSKNDELQNRLTSLTAFNLNCDVINENEAKIKLTECLSYFIKCLQVNDVYLPPWFVSWIIQFYQPQSVEEQFLKQRR